VLGVSKNASQEDIKKAYRKLAMVHHPDRGGDASKLTSINEAYEVIGDVNKRAEYDNPQARFNSNNWEDIFSPGGWYRRQHQPVNKNITIQAEIKLSDVVKGKRLYAKYRLRSGRDETVEIHIPPGIHHGETILYNGLGDDYLSVHRGDLIVKVRILPEKNWTRQNNDLMLTCSVNAIDMIAGGAVELTGIDGKQFKLKVHPGTQANAIFTVQEQGLPDRRSGRRGQLKIKLVPEIPKIHNAELLENLRNARDAAS